MSVKRYPTGRPLVTIESLPDLTQRARNILSHPTANQCQSAVQRKNPQLELSNNYAIATKMTPEEAVGRLSRITILADASLDQLHALSSSVTWRSVKAGEEVISHLSRDQHVYFVCDGVFRVRLEPVAGRGVQIRHLHAGQHFGEIAPLAQAPRSVTVSADTEGLVAECPVETFCALVRENGAVGLAVAANLARYVISLTDRLFETAALEVRFRIYAEVLRIAKSGQETCEGLTIHDAPTHDMIAQSVGTHREAVTKEFRYLTDENILRQNRRRELVVLDLDKLRDLIRKHAGLTASQVVDW